MNENNNVKWKEDKQFVKFLKEFGAAVKKTRETKRDAANTKGVFTQNYMADSSKGKKGKGVELDVKYYQLIESGKVNLSFHTFFKLIKRLESDIDIESLFK